MEKSVVRFVTTWHHPSEARQFGDWAADEWIRDLEEASQAAVFLMFVWWHSFFKVTQIIMRVSISLSFLPLQVSKAATSFNERNLLPVQCCNSHASRARADVTNVFTYHICGVGFEGWRNDFNSMLSTSRTWTVDKRFFAAMSNTGTGRQLPLPGGGK